MRLTLILFLFSSIPLFAQDFAPTPTHDPPLLPQNLEFEIIDMCSCGQETHYAGGIRALNTFINQNMVVPENIDWGEVDGVKAYVVFVVEKDGSLSDLHIIRTNFPELNERILDVFRKMTDWIPGEENCFPERSNVRVPVSIILK